MLGCVLVLQTRGIGSIPIATMWPWQSWSNAPDCGSGFHGFKFRRSPNMP